MGQKKKQPEKIPFRTGLIATGVFLCLALLVYWLAHRHNREWEVPDYLVGKWISFVPAYQDRYLEITKISLIFATGPSTVSEYFITNIITNATEQGTSFAIDSRDPEDISYQFFLIFQPNEHGGTLFFKNQQNVKWLKTSS